MVHPSGGILARSSFRAGICFFQARSTHISLSTQTLSAWLNPSNKQSFWPAILRPKSRTKSSEIRQKLENYCISITTPTAPALFFQISPQTILPHIPPTTLSNSTTGICHQKLGGFPPLYLQLQYRSSRHYNESIWMDNIAQKWQKHRATNNSTVV